MQSNTPKIDLNDLPGYKKALENLYLTETNFYFPNDSEDHAAAVFEVFLRLAKNRVKILCRNLKASVYSKPELVAALQQALARGVKIDIISEEKPEKSAFLEFLKASIPLNSTTVKTFNEKKLKVNFAVMDDIAFRWEDNNDHVKAVGNMYCKEFALKLSAYFNDISGDPHLINVV